MDDQPHELDAGRLLVAAIAGAVISFPVTALTLAVLDSVGVWPEDLMKWSGWAGCGAASGAVAGVLLGVFGRRVRFHPAVGAVAVGVLVGVAVVVLATLAFEEPLRQWTGWGRGRVRGAAVVYALPPAVVAGGVAGWWVWRWRQWTANGE